MKTHEEDATANRFDFAKSPNSARKAGRRDNTWRVQGITLLLAGTVLLFGSVAQAADKPAWHTSDWPHRTAADRSRIVTLIHNHETVLLLDLLRQGKRRQVRDVLFAMLGLSLMDVNAPNAEFSPGERKELCGELGPLGRLETSKLFRSYSHADPKIASDLRARIATLRKSCASH